jgi:hypothetical protein
MSRSSSIRWIYGYEICDIYDVKDAELWKAIEKRELTPYTNEGEPIDVDRLMLSRKKKIEAGTVMLKNAAQLAQQWKTDIGDVIPPDLVRHTPKNVKLSFYKKVKQYIYKIDEVDAFKSQKHSPGTDNEERDKNKDRKQCRERAKEYVKDCKAKKEKSSIATAINIIQSHDIGRQYTKRQVRNWITIKPRIFPEDSSKKGRRKNS